MQIVDAVTPHQIGQVRVLFSEYWKTFGFTPCFQGFGGELAALPGDYERIWLAIEAGEAAGCVAIRRLDADRAEFKRLYVRPKFRGTGLGRQLLTEVMAAARAWGCRELLCDTMPVMADALAMYQRHGFAIVGPYTDKATAGAIYLKLTLES